MLYSDRKINNKIQCNKTRIRRINNNRTYLVKEIIIWLIRIRISFKIIFSDDVSDVFYNFINI